jgi:hypothetical protein
MSIFVGHRSSIFFIHFTNLTSISVIKTPVTNKTIYGNNKKPFIFSFEFAF